MAMIDRISPPVGKRRARRLALVASLVAAVAIPLAALPAHAQDKVVRSFKVGTGLNSAGVLPGGNDEEPSGPSAIYAAPDGKLYVLDQVNGRVISMDPNSPGTGSVKTLELPEGLKPTDLVATSAGLFVWDGQVHALGTARSDTQTEKVEARAVASVDDVTRSAFAQMGSQAPASDEELLDAAAGRSLTPDALQAPVKQFLSSRGLGAVTIDVIPQKNVKTAVVELRQQSDPLNVTRFAIEVTDRVGSIEVLEVSAKGEVFVFVENVPTNTKQKAATYVARYTPKGKLDKIYDLPISPDQASTRRSVTISEKGNVFFLKSDTSAVNIVDLAARPATGQVLKPAPVKVASADLGDDFDDAGLIAAVRPSTRSAVIQIGLAFEAFKWNLTPANYGADPDSSCSGFSRIRRPWYLQGKAGQQVRGVPYCWGCFGTLAQFQRKVERGVLAGNVCTRDDPRRDVAGVDCSAFVSATWGLSRHFTTRDIPGITQELGNPWDLKPGDALNKAGSHVMLFVRFTPDRKAEVLEAATGGCNGRVCRNVYPLSTLLARGYRPVRYPALTD